MRHGCHLCDDMLLALDSLNSHPPFELNITDISGDEKLESRYGTRVPVLVGEQGAEPIEICYYFLDKEALLAYFSRR